MSFPAKVYEINMFYYCIYLLKSKCRNTPNCIIMLCYLCDDIITSEIIIGVVCVISVYNIVLPGDLNKNR